MYELATHIYQTYINLYELWIKWLNYWAKISGRRNQDEYSWRFHLKGIIVMVISINNIYIEKKSVQISMRNI